MMKYFEKLPKRTYETSIGNFTISDFFSYYKFNTDLVATREFEYDSKTTLMEAGFKLYNDPNSFWLLLLANKWLNPFTLLEKNYSLFTKQSENKTTLKLKTADNEYINGDYVTVGTLIFPQTNTSGEEYEFSSVGTFDIDGPIYIVENQDFYTKRVTVKPTTTNAKASLESNTSLSFADLNASENWDTTANSTSYIAVQSIDFLDTTAVYAQVAEQQVSVFQDMQPQDVPYPDSSGQAVTTNQTQDQTAKQVDKNIKIFVPNELSKITTRLVTIKYS